MIRCDDAPSLVLTRCAPNLAPCERTDPVFRHEHLSVSRMRTYVACPRSFFYHYIAHAPKRSGADTAARFGNLVHTSSETISKWIVANEFVGTLGVETIRNGLAEAWKAEGEGLDPGLFGEALDMLRGYYARRVDAWAIVDVEREVRIPAGRFTILGFVDRVEHAREGGLVVIDMKTSRLLYDPDDLKEDLQACLYVGAIRTVYPTAERFSFRFDMMRFGSSQHHAPVTPAMSEEAAVYLGVIGEMTERLPAREDAFPAKLQPNCAYCDYQEICDVYQRAARAPVTEKKHLAVLANDALLAERARVAAIAKTSYAAQKEIDALIKRRIAEEGPIEAGGFRAKTIPQTVRVVDVERLRRMLAEKGIATPEGLYGVSLALLDELVDAIEDEVTKAEILSTVMAKDGTPKIDVKAIGKRLGSEIMVPHLTDASFYDVFAAPTPSLVTFSSPTRCRDCALQKAALDALVAEGWPVYVVNVESPEAALVEDVYGRRGVPFHRVVAEGQFLREHLGRSDVTTLRDLLRGTFAGNGGDLKVKRPTPELWALLHRSEGGSPDLLAEVRRELPCQPCIEHFDAYVKENPPPYGPGWFGWTVTFHNAVNARLGKHIYTLPEATKEWR